MSIAREGQDLTSPSAGRVRARARVVALQRSAPLAQIIALAGLYGVGAATLEGFTSLASLKAMLVLAALLGLAATGQTIVVLLGGLDLSIAGFISFGDVLFAVLSGKGWAFVPALAVVLAIALALGAVNGYLCARFGLQPIVVTIAMGFVLVGIAQVEVSNFTVGAVPAFLERFSSATGQTLGLGIPPVVVMWAIVAILTSLTLARTRLGRHIYQTGSNPVAAELALVRTLRIRTGAFAFSALCAAVVGVLLAGFTGSADASAGDQYLFTSLAAVIVGGTSIVGARGDYWRTVVGALIITVLSTLLIGHGYGTGDQQILFGVAILLVVVVYGREARLRDRV